MKLRSPIFDALARIYEESRAGRTGRGRQDVQPTFEDLCAEFADSRGLSLDGESFELAVTELKSCHGRIVELEWDNPRARTTIHKVRLSPGKESEFYAELGRESPTQRRQRWSDLFLQASSWPVPERFSQAWQKFCVQRAERAIHWDAMEPFRVRKFHEGQHLIETTRQLLGWEGSNMIRWVSSHLCGNSKTLETALKSRDLLLQEASGGQIASLEAHGILPMPREARFSGPLRLQISGQVVDCGALQVATLSLADLERAELIACEATRCLTVENKTVFLDLAQKCSGEMIIWTSFPNAATLALLALLPRTLEFHHFGDTDPSGFHILHDLSRRSLIPFTPFRMHVREHAAAREVTTAERHLLGELLGSPHLVSVRTELQALLDTGNIGAFEQEDHQPAPLVSWPFYGDRIAPRD